MSSCNRHGFWWLRIGLLTSSSCARGRLLNATSGILESKLILSVFALTSKMPTSLFLSKWSFYILAADLSSGILKMSVVSHRWRMHVRPWLDDFVSGFQDSWSECESVCFDIFWEPYSLLNLLTTNRMHWLWSVRFSVRHVVSCVRVWVLPLFCFVSPAARRSRLR